MKISCVRCGKKIDSPNVYCRECQKDMGIAIGNPPRSKRRWYTYLLILLLFALAGAYFFTGNREIVSKVSSLASEVEQTAEGLKETVFNQLRIEEAETEKHNSDLSKTVAFQNAQEKQDSLESSDVSGDTDQPQQVSELKQKAEAALSSPEATITDTPMHSEEAAADPGSTESPETAPAAIPEKEPENAADQTLTTATSTEQNESTVSDSAEASMAQAEEAAKNEDAPDTAAPDAENSLTPAATAPATEEDNPLLHVGILVYYLKNKGADERIQRKLLDAGYTDVEAKGKWPGAFNDQNVFFRSEDQPGVKEIVDILGDNWFDYYYNGPRISRSVKKIFNEKDHVQFLVIPK